MDAAAIIALVRDGQTPEPAALAWFAQALADGRVSDAQAGAFAMAVCLNGLGEAGRVALTLAMRDSGARLDWSLPGPVLDKHSTGGVGDCVSLLLAPALAACGAFVPMISGRGLGHTGGTLDKLEAIPGYRAEVAEDRLRSVVGEVGCAIVGATGQIAPADRRLYAVRDVTATVESVDLITASILAKKLAAGLDALVLDVKTGSGAVMATPDAARDLARALVDTAKGAGCPTVALITDMNQPLATTAGNALEVAEVMETLTRTRPSPRLWDLTLALGGEVLALSGLAADATAGAARVEAALRSGAAAERFGAMVAALGGPGDFLDRWRDHLPQAPVIRDVPALTGGMVRTIDTRALGQIVVRLGGGRQREGDAIDPRVGLGGIVALGEVVAPGAPLAQVHAADAASAEAAIAAVRAACSLDESLRGESAPGTPLIKERIA